jgi:hypothetical protein
MGQTSSSGAASILTVRPLTPSDHCATASRRCAKCAADSQSGVCDRACHACGGGLFADGVPYRVTAPQPYGWRIWRRVSGKYGEQPLPPPGDLKMSPDLPRCAVCRLTIQAGDNVVFREDGRVHHSVCRPVSCPVCDGVVRPHDPIRRDGDLLVHGRCWARRYRQAENKRAAS